MKYPKEETLPLASVWDDPIAFLPRDTEVYGDLPALEYPKYGDFDADGQGQYDIDFEYGYFKAYAERYYGEAALHVDWRHWMTMPFWDSYEAACLLFGIEPLEVRDQEIGQFLPEAVIRTKRAFDQEVIDLRLPVIERNGEFLCKKEDIIEWAQNAVAMPSIVRARMEIVICEAKSIGMWGIFATENERPGWVRRSIKSLRRVWTAILARIIA